MRLPLYLEGRGPWCEDVLLRHILEHRQEVLDVLAILHNIISH